MDFNDEGDNVVSTKNDNQTEAVDKSGSSGGNTNKSVADFFANIKEVTGVLKVKKRNQR